MAHLPATLEELTPEWLTDTLRSEGTIDAATRVASATSERLGEGVGFIGIVGRLCLTYDGGSGPATMVAKLPSPDEGARTIGNLYGLYEREVRFYEDVATDAGLTVPGCYFRTWDAEAGRSLILLEDLAPHGAIGDQVAGCSSEQTALALSELATFHARWWSSPRLDSIPWLMNGTDLVRASMTQAYSAAVGPFLRDFGDQLAGPVRAAVPRLHEHVLAMMDETDDRGIFTIAHGDYRIDNMSFGKPGAPYRLAVIDWQSPNRGWGAYDVAYFLSGSIDPAARRASEMKALAAYIDGLRAGGVTNYTLEELEYDYRRSLLVYLALFVVNAATLERSNERAVQLFEVIFDRLNAAIVDLDALATLPS